MMRTLMLILLSCAVLAGCGPGSNAPVGQQIDALMQNAVRQGFSGNVLVMRGNAVLYRRSFGMADRAAARLNSADTPFLIASVSKPLTALLVLRLVEQGRLTPATRLEQIFPQTRGTQAGSVTVAQLLSHTSGLEEVIERHLPRAITADDLKAAVIVGTPGRHAYSGSGYVVLKLVAEKASGVSYSELLEREILAPANMRRSGVLRDGAVADLALAYASSDGTKPVRRSAPLAVIDGAGSLYSTVDDLARLDRALRENRLLRPETQALMNRDQTGSGDWSYGWALSEQGGRYYPWHRGDFDGYHALLVRQVHSGECVVILSNSDSMDVSALKNDLMRILRRTRAQSN
jgi:CubicO group peptidase (beta-lactamase class C family)